MEPHREELAGVVIESTYNWYFLVDGLMDAGYRVHLANTTAIKKYEGLKYSGEFADAAYLAQLLRLGLLPEGYIYPREERAGRDLGRTRRARRFTSMLAESTTRLLIPCAMSQAVQPEAVAPVE